MTSQCVLGNLGVDLIHPPSYVQAKCPPRSTRYELFVKLRLLLAFLRELRLHGLEELYDLPAEGVTRRSKCLID